MTYATFTDVQTKYDQPLDSSQQTRVERVLDDLSDLLDEIVPSLAVRAAVDTRLARTARRVVVDAAIRALDNPRGYQGESAGEVSYYFALNKNPTGPGRPFTEDELRPLRPKGRVRVGTIRVNVPGDHGRLARRTLDAPLPPAGYDCDPWDDPWRTV